MEQPKDKTVADETASNGCKASLELQAPGKAAGETKGTNWLKTL